MRGRGRRSWVAVAAALCMVLPASACGPGEDPAGSPTPQTPATSTPTEVSASPSPSPSASESFPTDADFKAAEKAYRDFAAERNRLAMAGGTSQPTAALSDTAAGPYLEEMMGYLREQKKLRQRTDRPFVIRNLAASSARRNNAPTNELTLRVCEDGTKVTSLDKDGKPLFHGQAIKGQLYVRLVDGKWKVWDGEGKAVSKCGG